MNKFTSYLSTDQVELANEITKTIESDSLNEIAIYCEAKSALHQDYEVIGSVALQYKLQQSVTKLFKTPYTMYDVVTYGVEVAGIYHPNMKSKFIHLTGDTKLMRPCKDVNRIFPDLGILSVKTLCDRYVAMAGPNNQPLETIAMFFMRVALGLSYDGSTSTAREHAAIKLFNSMTSLEYMPSTPTLFNSGMIKSQLSSCFVSSVGDSIESIFGTLKDNAHISKHAGGIAVDWSDVRGAGSSLGQNSGASYGVAPFIKVYNTMQATVNQGGKRRGAGAAYLEVWHSDIYQFIDLKKTTGDDRMRCHDLNTAVWICDLFMERVELDGDWLLFSPNHVPELHSLYGTKFATKYKEYEALFKLGKVDGKKIKAVDLWRYLLQALYETGHPWVTFKDTFNHRNPQSHAGIIRSSNLCTEIGLNTSSTIEGDGEIAVCNLGSINLPAFVKDDLTIDTQRLIATIRLAVRALNNVINTNHHVVEQARKSNQAHRAIGLGVMGLQSLLHKLKLPFDSDEAIIISTQIQQLINYYSMDESAELAKKFGPYSSYAGSTWSKLHLTADLYAKWFKLFKRGISLTAIKPMTIMRYQVLKSKIKKYGIYNSNLTAIAPTATISNICGSTQSVEPQYANAYTKVNLSGEFTVVNKYLRADLTKLGLWDEEMLERILNDHGSVQNIDPIPDHLKKIYKTAFECDYTQVLRAAGYRQQFIDQSQSINLYLTEPDGDRLSKYLHTAHKYGLKSTYYLRSRGGSQINKAITDPGELPVSVCNTQKECDSCQ